jgi:hypothetical protein
MQSPAAAQGLHREKPCGTFRQVNFSIQTGLENSDGACGKQAVFHGKRLYHFLQGIAI